MAPKKVYFTPTPTFMYFIFSYYRVAKAKEKQAKLQAFFDEHNIQSPDKNKNRQSENSANSHDIPPPRFQFLL